MTKNPTTDRRLALTFTTDRPENADDERAILERLTEAQDLYREYLAITEVSDLAKLLAHDDSLDGPPRTDLPLTLTIQ